MAECYTCKNHYWTHWPQFGRKEWDSGCIRIIKRPPQSWCYVEEEVKNNA